jgi:hypothetical protein
MVAFGIVLLDEGRHAGDLGHGLHHLQDAAPRVQPPRGACWDAVQFYLLTIKKGEMLIKF